MHTRSENQKPTNASKALPCLPGLSQKQDHQIFTRHGILYMKAKVGVNEQIQVEGQGIFHINPGCTARFDHYKFKNTNSRNSFAKRVENLPQMMIPHELITRHPEIFHISTLDPVLEGISIKTYLIINATNAILALALGYHIYYECMPTCARRMINFNRQGSINV